MLADIDHLFPFLVLVQCENLKRIDSSSEESGRSEGVDREAEHRGFKDLKGISEMPIAIRLCQTNARKANQKWVLPRLFLRLSVWRTTVFLEAVFIF